MESDDILKLNEIKKKIYTIRGKQVMLDSDLAKLYGVETKRLLEQVRRNKERFPEEFMFQLTKEEYESLRSQFATLKSGRGKHKKYLPYVFTEQGVAMLSAVLRSKTAIDVSIRIMNAFVEMRRFIIENAEIFARLDRVEYKLSEHDKNFEKVFKALESKDSIPPQGIFFNGQIFDAYKFVSDLIRSAKKSIIIIDNYIDDTVLTLLIKRKEGVKATIYTKKITKTLKLDLEKHNQQYPPVEIKEIKKFHDRFLIIDNKDVYHIGASLKDLGKKVFAFSKMNIKAIEMLSEIEEK